jgi:hypothetical protein
VLLETSGASLALSIEVLAGGALGADTNAVTDLNISLGLGTDADGGTDELVADTAGVVGGSLWSVSSTFSRKVLVQTYPSAAKSVQVRTTDTAVRDLDINIGLFPGLRLKLLPDHLPLASLRVEAHPALELVIGGRHYVIDSVAESKIMIIEGDLQTRPHDSL